MRKRVTGCSRRFGRFAAEPLEVGKLGRFAAQEKAGRLAASRPGESELIKKLIENEISFSFNTICNTAFFVLSPPQAENLAFYTF